MDTLKNLNPKPVWHYFEEIAQIPRPSKKEEKIRAYLIQFAKKHKLSHKTDAIGNVLIVKKATAGKENAPTVVLQSHMDMVCEKNADKTFNFDEDPIELVLDGEWLKANGTTLGADNGIGVAAQLAVLASQELEHGPIECLFTVDEETGLSGAFALEPNFISGNILLNLDSEDDGEIFIGCAGGIDTVGSLPVEYAACASSMFAMRVSVSGLMGGHSGDDINKGRANANKILARLLKTIGLQCEFELASFKGGNLRNAIAREAEAIVVVSQNKKELFVSEANIFLADVEKEYQYTDSGIKISCDSTPTPTEVLDRKSKNNLLNLILSCPHGVLEMSYSMPGMVETSTNLASVKIEDKQAVFTTSQRSDLESRKYAAAQMLRACFEMAGASVCHSDGYPGWQPNPKSYIARLAAESYTSLFGTKPAVKSIHAGLECGLFLTKYPSLDMVSIGPTIRNAHSPDERIHIQHTEKFWLHLIDILRLVAN